MRSSMSRVWIIILGIAFGASGFTTVMVMADYSPLESDLTTVIALLNVDLILALAIGALLARRIVRAWIGRRFGIAGSRLHLRMVLSFSLVAIIPAILVAVFSGLFLNFGIESWFSERVATAVNQSRNVAQLYLQEHRQNIRAEALAMANDLNRAAPQLRQNPRILNELVTRIAAIRGLPEAVIVDSGGRTMTRLRGSYSLGFDFSTHDLLKGVLNRRSGEVFIISSTDDDRVRAGVKLESFVDAYLLVGRFVDQQVLDHISQTRGASAQYRRLQQSRESLQVKFLLVFGLVAMLLLLTAVWIGWSLASQLSTPIGRLIEASERVRKGDLTARVEEINTQRDEVGTLSNAFNRMTERLDSQQRGLIEANRQLDERRRFTETVLAGVSAGVIGLDGQGRIHLPNRSASELLETDLTQHFDAPLGQAVPEMEQLLNRVIAQPDRTAQGEISLVRDGTKKTFLTSVAAERINREVIGYVVTFDDVTELLSAQRKAAWADVARRIAHEIKNPLTPIRLSAERLKRKYQHEIASDPDTFAICTDTIMRQVEDIGRMVDEFSSFARMPQPDLRRIDLGDLCRQSIFLEKNRYPGIEYVMDAPEGELSVYCDRLQIGRALTNILKNAAESIHGRTEPQDGEPEPGRIELKLLIDENRPRIEIRDNGKGFPGELLDRVTEPYVTTRDRGTGLGLAIAKKIAEDHSGELLLQNNADVGASVIIILSEIEASEIPAPDAEPSDTDKNIEAVSHGA
ncbi:MAG: PAS domain-containing sensor histidine kinase [Rhodospirillales bacterium]|nr:PAS domain-containing sensor histidine kinase [Rhodospirillales bacterium]MDP6841154.1 PAS domain-containing sensor histidine kinase [Rhodospirillales bacterium]